MLTSWALLSFALCHCRVSLFYPYFSKLSFVEPVTLYCAKFKGNMRIFYSYIYFTHTMSLTRPLSFSHTHSVLSAALVTWSFTPSWLLHVPQYKEIASKARWRNISASPESTIFFCSYISQHSCNSNFVLLRRTMEHGDQSSVVTFKVEKWENRHRLGK